MSMMTTLLINSLDACTFS